MSRGSDESSTTTIQVDTARRLIRVVLSGRIGDVEGIRIYKLVAAMPEFQNGFDVIFDCTPITEPMSTGLGQYELAKLSENDCNRVAIIANNPRAFGMAQMYEICANWKGERVGVFQDEQSALQWLDIRVETAKPEG